MAELWYAKAEEVTGGKFKPWRVHDLCRTCATGMRRRDGSEPCKAPQGGHRRVYQHSQHRDAVKATFEDWGSRIECVSAWNKDPVIGVIGIQLGPR